MAWLSTQASIRLPSDSRSRGSFESDGLTAVGSDVETPFLEKQAWLHQPTSLTLQDHFRHTPKRIARLCSPSGAATFARSIALALLPSYLGDRLSRTPPKPAHANGIAALDGLRGLACLFVFNEHLSYNYGDRFLWGYGSSEQSTIIQLPFIRILWSGSSMVAVFFVVSGYVLSVRPLKQIQAKDMASFQRTMTSSVLRRGLRLYLPTFIAVLLCGFLVWLGGFSVATRIYQEGDNYLRLHEPPPTSLDGLWPQMIDAMQHALQMLQMWRWNERVDAGNYDLHTWTILVEFRASMVLFLILIGTSRLRQAWRIIAATAVIVFCIAYECKDVLLFVSGMLIAELDVIRKSGTKSILPTSLSSRLPGHRLSSALVWPFIFFIGLYISSVPTNSADATPGYKTLTSLVPSCFHDRTVFLQAVGAVLITWPTANSTVLQPIFTNRFASYLGKISYALYLVHGNVLKTIGYAAMPTIYSITNDGTRQGMTRSGWVMSWLLGAVAVLPVTFWLADLFWRAVDLPCVRFAKWVEEKTSDEFGEVDIPRKTPYPS